MEKIIIVLLLVVIALLLYREKPRLPKTEKALKAPQKPEENYSVMGASTYVPKTPQPVKAEAQVKEQEPSPQEEANNEANYPLEIPVEELDAIFAPSIDFEDEEEELHGLRSPEEDEDFATGLTFEELGQFVPLLSNSNTSEVITPDTLVIAKKVENTNLLEALDRALPKISALLEKYLPKPADDVEEVFDIGEFV
ncbi:hypothetical protein [Capnocytophaga leadbetteri]|jgi:hypothetical protein|uniref:hypothetical protein n=1 Tax=Capnocytophaga leadbetteri TaxID=327575 RepID=UPI0012FFBCDD|nr:hypothetical protein [Capnocytophaga leadbetteri]